MPRFPNPKSIASILVGWKLEARLEVILMMMLTEKQADRLTSVKGHRDIKIPIFNWAHFHAGELFLQRGLKKLKWVNINKGFT